MTSARVVFWKGSDPANRQVELTVTQVGSGFYSAIWAPGYCGCSDCKCLMGMGKTPEAATADFWTQWEEKYS